MDRIKKILVFLLFFVFLIASMNYSSCEKKDEICKKLRDGEPIFENTLTDFSLPVVKEGSFRAIVVGYKQDIHNAKNLESFKMEIERIITNIRPYFNSNTMNLVVFPELLGLQTAFIGAKGLFATEAYTIEDAFMLLGVQYNAQIALYTKCYPQITLPNALFLSLTDTMTRAFYETFSQIAKQEKIYIIAGTISPLIQISYHLSDITFFGDKESLKSGYVYLPISHEVYNVALFFNPQGEVIGITRKVNLTPLEKQGDTTLSLTPGDYDHISVYDTPMGNIGIAICYDAFHHDYLARLNDLGAHILVQPSFNPQQWAGYVRDGEVWQPEEWLYSILGSISEEFPSIHYNLCSMMTGNFFSITVDGQSTVTAKSKAYPNHYYGLIGLDPITNYKGTFLGISPWVIEDPVLENPDLTLQERREILIEMGDELKALSGSPMENHYKETMIVIDIPIKDE